jgi:hypothetical protein
MTDEAKVNLDANRSATLHNGAVSTEFPSLQEAVTAWHRLRPEQAQKASIRIFGGRLYVATEIRQLLNGSRSKEAWGVFCWTNLRCAMRASIMTNVRVIAIIGLVAIGPDGSIAMPPQEIPGGVKDCKAIGDNAKRLQCFDSLFAESPEPTKPAESPQARSASPDNQAQKPAADGKSNWSIDEKQSSDGSQGVVALNFLGDDAVFILRCKNGITRQLIPLMWIGLATKT